MAILTPKQKKVLRLCSKGKNVTEIARETGESYNSVSYAFKSGKKNLEATLKTVEWAINERIISPVQAQRLKETLQKI